MEEVGCQKYLVDGELKLPKGIYSYSINNVTYCFDPYDIGMIQRLKINPLTSLPFVEGGVWNPSIPSLTKLPYEITFEIAYGLPLESVLALCKTDKKMSEVCRTQSFWREYGRINETRHPYEIYDLGPYLVDAAMIGNIDLVQRLVWAGAHTQETLGYEAKGGVALEKAVEGNHYDVVKLLLKYKIEGENALQLAIEKGYIDLTKLLFNEEDLKGYELSDAVVGGHYDVVKFLLDKEFFDQSDLEQPLITAFLNDHFDIVNLLLDNGVDPSSFNEDDLKSVLAVIIESCGENLKNKKESDKCNLEMIEILINKSQNINALGDALNDAVSWHLKDVVKLLLDKGVHPNPLDDSPFTFAIENHDQEMVKILLGKGVIPDCNDVTNTVYEENIDLLKLLLDHIPEDSEYDCVVMALDTAEEADQTDIINYILSEYGELDSVKDWKLIHNM